MTVFATMTAWHDRVVGALDRAAEGWFMGLTARLVFSSVTLLFFLNSAMTKFGAGIFGIFNPSVGAYAQIMPPIAEAAGYDPAQIAFFPWTLIVIAGTAAEFLLPVLILVGLLTRLSAVAMIGFIVVMSVVDVQFHGLDAASVGAMFDRFADAVIFDQRLLWLFPLVYLVLKGPGSISADAVLARTMAERRA